MIDIIFVLFGYISYTIEYPKCCRIGNEPMSSHQHRPDSLSLWINTNAKSFASTKNAANAVAMKRESWRTGVSRGGDSAYVGSCKISSALEFYCFVVVIVVEHCPRPRRRIKYIRNHDVQAREARIWIGAFESDIWLWPATTTAAAAAAVARILQPIKRRNGYCGVCPAKGMPGRRMVGSYSLDVQDQSDLCGKEAVYEMPSRERMFMMRQTKRKRVKVHHFAIISF